MSFEVTLSFGGVNFCLKPDCEDAGSERKLCASPIVSVKQQSNGAVESSDADHSGGFSGRCIIAQLSGFSGSLRISMISPVDVDPKPNGIEPSEAAVDTSTLAMSPESAKKSQKEQVEEKHDYRSHTDVRSDNESPHINPQDHKGSPCDARLDEVNEATGGMSDDGDMTFLVTPKQGSFDLFSEAPFSDDEVLTLDDPSGQIRKDTSDHSPLLTKAQVLVDTPLHLACAAPNATLAELRSLLEVDPTSASQADANGRLPLHVLSENDCLLSTAAGRSVVEAFSVDLLDVDPAAVIAADAKGRTPFTSIVRDWVMSIHEQAHEKRGSATYSRQNDPYGVLKSAQLSQAADIASSTDLARFHRLCPNNVRVTMGVELAFVVLSAALDRFSGPLNLGADTRRDQIESRDTLARSFASIPFLLKSVLLIEDIDKRKRIMDMSLFKRVICCSETGGPWIIFMMNASTSKARRVVDYFRLVSGAGIFDYIGNGRSPRTEDWIAYHQSMDGLFGAIASHRAILPSLVALPKKDVEKASRTKLVWIILNVTISNPFIIGGLPRQRC